MPYSETMSSMQSPGRRRMVKADICGSAPKRMRANMRNFYANSMRVRMNIRMPLLGSGSSRFGSNFQAFALFMHVGTNIPVPI